MIAPLYFVVFVLMAQFVLVNVVVAVLMKHLEESHKHMDDDIEMDAEIERQIEAELQAADSVRRKVPLLVYLAPNDKKSYCIHIRVFQQSL